MARRQGRVQEQGGWLDHGGVASGDLVVFSPREVDELFCLDARNGQLKWRAPRESALLIGGIVGDRVLPFSDRETVEAALKEMGA